MVPSSPPGDISDADEDELREKVLEGLRLALNDEFLGPGTTERRDLTKTEEEKLLYFAIQDLELPLTYSWFLAGAKTKSNAGSSAQDSPSGTTTPRMNLSIGAYPSTTPSGTSDTDPEVERYRNYFRTETFFGNYNLKKVVYTNKTEFLCDFYRKFAEDEYEDLYIHSTKLRQKLEDIENLLETTNQDTTLSDWGGGSDSGVLSVSEEKQFRRLVSEIQLDLAGIDDLNECRLPVRQATDEIEIVLTKLTHLSSLTEKQREVLDELGDFYYNSIWRYPALKISEKTAEGPHSNTLSTDRGRQFSTFHNRLHSRTEKFREKRIKAGFTPSTEEFAANDPDEVMESIHNMTRDSLGDSSE